jgi:single-strand DNA-binding protein
MSDVNNVTLIGRLTRDAELRYTSSGKPVSKFSLAVNEKRKVGDGWEDTASFIEIVLWGQLGETLKQYLTKGKQVAVIGKLTQERWEQDGQNRSKLVVTAATIQLLGGTSGNEGGPARKQGGTASQSAAPSADYGLADNIPF